MGSRLPPPLVPEMEDNHVVALQGEEDPVAEEQELSNLLRHEGVLRRQSAPKRVIAQRLDGCLEIVKPLTRLLRPPLLL